MKKIKKFDADIVDFDKSLSISRDYNTRPSFFFPVFLFTPDPNDTNNHFHISLTKKQAIKLRDWLNKYIRDRS